MLDLNKEYQTKKYGRPVKNLQKSVSPDGKIMFSGWVDIHSNDKHKTAWIFYKWTEEGNHGISSLDLVPVPTPYYYFIYVEKTLEKGYVFFTSSVYPTEKDRDKMIESILTNKDIILVKKGEGISNQP